MQGQARPLIEIILSKQPKTNILIPQHTNMFLKNLFLTAALADAD